MILPCPWDDLSHPGIILSCPRDHILTLWDNVVGDILTFWDIVSSCDDLILSSRDNIVMVWILYCSKDNVVNSWDDLIL